MTIRVLAALGMLLTLAGCAGLSDDMEDYCRDSSHCSPQCGTVATGALPECDPYQREGRTRG